MKRLRLWFRRRQLLRRYLNRIGYQLLLEEIQAESELKDKQFHGLESIPIEGSELTTTLDELMKAVDSAPKYDLDKIKMDVINKRSRGY